MAVVQQRAIPGQKRGVKTVELVRVVEMLGIAEVLQATQVGWVMSGMMVGEVVAWWMMRTIHIMTQFIETIQIIFKRVVTFKSSVHVQKLVVRPLVAAQQIDAGEITVHGAIHLAVEQVRIVQSSDHIRRTVAFAGVAQIAVLAVARNCTTDADIGGYLVTSIGRLLQVTGGGRLTGAAGSGGQ